MPFALSFFHALGRPGEAIAYIFRYTAHMIGFLFLGMKNGRLSDAPILSCYPRVPLPIYTLWAMAQVCGFTLRRGVSDRAILFQDTTHMSSSSLPKDADNWINGRCLDIRKSSVAKAFESIAHRQLFLDPNFRGAMVEKTEANGLHSGRIVHGPLQRPRRGYTYQRLVHNETENGKDVEDLRTVIVGTHIPLVYRKRRPIDRRFEDHSARVSIIDPASVFSHDEQEMLIHFARHVGLDFGEMDVLRDRGNGCLYIVDVNKTTISPPVILPFRARRDALRSIGKAFEREFLKGTNAST